MSIAAYPLQSAIPSYAEFELYGGQNNGSAFVLRGQASGAPTIIRPRVTPIQEASMSVAINATVNTLYNNSTANGYEGIGVTMELLKISDNGLNSIWNNGLFGQISNLWIGGEIAKRDWHKLTWIQEIPQIGADLLNIGLVNKCPSGWAKLSNLSLTNHYTRYYEMVKSGTSDSIELTQVTESKPVIRWFTYFEGGPLVPMVIVLPQTWWRAYLDTIPLSIRGGENINQNAAGVIGGWSDSDSDVPIELGIELKYRGRDGTSVYKDLVKIKSESAVIDDTQFTESSSWVADQDYTMVEPILFVKTKYGRVHLTNASHKGIKIDISSTRNLLSSR